MSTAVIHETPRVEAEFATPADLKAMAAAEQQQLHDESENKAVAATTLTSEATTASTAAESTSPAAAAAAVPHEDYADDEIPLYVRLSSYFGLVVVYLWACLTDYIVSFFVVVNPTPEGYAPMTRDFDEFYLRQFYGRIRDCFTRPIDSRPSRVIGVMERESLDGGRSLTPTGKIVPAINLGSYNYLGFAEDTPFITRTVIETIDDYGVASCSTPQEVGQSASVAALEREFAAFIGKEAAIVCGMGFSTNFCGIPGLFGADTLVASDSLNHSSLINGMRSSGAKVRPFKHGDYAQLEALLREAVVLGQQPTGAYKPWKRIVIIIEGIYSMEGEICNLPRFVELKKRYGALLFVDEAHSIGALGPNGRGVCEHFGVNPADVDVLMGTFTKSFGSIGGYIAADRALIDYVRSHSTIGLECDTLAPPCAQQALSVLHVLLGKDGSDLGRKRIQQLRENARFLRQGLVDLGLAVLGDNSSPVIPVMCYTMSKMPELCRRCMAENLAIVVVGYPATPLLGGRVRFCVSACHTREDLQHTIDVMRKIADDVYITYHPEKAIKA